MEGWHIRCESNGGLVNLLVANGIFERSEKVCAEKMARRRDLPDIVSPRDPLLVWLNQSGVVVETHRL